jgi:flagellar basal-body rod protein FlgB
MGSMPPLIDGLGQAMRHLAERQRVISQNIANSETPGFKAREVAVPSFAGLVAAQGAAGTPHVTPPRVELTGSMAALGARTPRSGHIIVDSDTSETKPDGNSVVLEDQLLKMGSIQADFSTMTNIYRKQMGLLKTATGRGGS